MNITSKEFAEAIADAYSRGYKDGVASVKPQPYVSPYPTTPWHNQGIRPCDEIRITNQVSEGAANAVRAAVQKYSRGGSYMSAEYTEQR